VDPEIGAVVAGLDRKLNYYKLSYAYLALTQIKDCKFIATNTDAQFPGTHTLLPGGGAIIASIVATTGMQPLVMGKPEPMILDLLAAQHNLNRARTCMVGDRLDTDIEFGNKGGLKTLLVLTGVTTFGLLMDSKTTIHPHYYTDSIADILKSKHASL